MQASIYARIPTHASSDHVVYVQVIYLEDGRIAAQGTYEQVRENERFVSLLQEFNSGGLDGDAGSDADSTQVCT